MRILVHITIASLLAITLGACGSDSGSSRPSEPGSSNAPTPASDRPVNDRPSRRLDPAAQCVGSRTSAGPLLATRDLAAARTTVLDAARRATTTGHRFSIALDLRAGRLRGEATIYGRRMPDNTSAALVRWTGAAGALLPDLGMRIVADRLYLQTGQFDAPWRLAGSASGVSLDVGRELLDHPFLLTTTNARGTGGMRSVTFAAPADQLRAYATSERRGPVTDLLRQARQLTLVAHVRGGQLVGDRFTLVTTVPEALRRGPIRAGVPIRIVGASSYCRLRSVDRARISAPRVSD